METYSTWCRLFELLPYYSWIIDRFHISTQVVQHTEHGRTYEFGWLEERLARLDFRLIFCTRSEESFAAARAKRLKISGNPAQYDDLTIFHREQERMQDLVKRSRLKTFHLDVSDDNIPAACERIADWLENTGGLHATY
jgi:thymidylate kinase